MKEKPQGKPPRANGGSVQRSVSPLFALESENLTGLGGPMGSERTWTNWRKFFKTVSSAKAFAEKDYGKAIQWDKSNCSGDLRYVMYHIKRVKVEG